MLRTTFFALALAMGGPVSAHVFDFAGTRTNMNPSTPPGTGRCVPPYFSTTEIVPDNFFSTGMSNFGSFKATLNHCNVGPVPSAVVDGHALLEFDAGDSLFAIYTGSVALTDVVGVFASTQQWIVTGGTGRFFNASGAVSHDGLIRVGLHQGVRVGIYEGSFTGRLNMPAIPEPATWALMISGFAMAGAACRRAGTARIAVKAA